MSSALNGTIIPVGREIRVERIGYEGRKIRVAFFHLPFTDCNALLLLRVDGSSVPSGIKRKETHVVPLVTSNVRNALVGCAVQISIFAISDKPSNRVPLRPPWLPDVRSLHLSPLDSSLDLLREQSWRR